jgi:hypothetical protein
MTCDRCGARAIWRATLVSGGTLDFCNHHYLERQHGLKAAGAKVTALQPSIAGV